MKLNFNPIVDNQLAYFPKKYANQAILLYFVALGACTILYMKAALPFAIMAMGIVSILLFFNGSNALGRKWARLSEKAFVKKVLVYAFIIRLVYAVFIVLYNNAHYGIYWESNVGDIGFYFPTGLQLAKMHGVNLWAGFQTLLDWNVQISDTGYIIYIQLVSAILGLNPEAVADHDRLGHEYVLIFLALKAVMGAYTCIFTYRIAQRHFGEKVARMTAIFCMLQWNMIWWCGSMMKETEMVFIAMLFVNQMDKVIYGLNLKPWYIAATVLIGLSLFTFRSALFMTSIAATGLALVLTHTHTLSTGKKVLAGIMIAAAMAFAMGDTIMEEVQEVVNTAQNSNYQKTNMEWRSNRSGGGNKFAKYAGAAVFAPLIFTIPFPNMVYTTQDQEMLMMVNGGNFEKNVLSFFIVFAMFQLLLSGQWRQHVFPIAYYVGYLAALVLSVFAQSGRFHMPIMPMAMMFGAYGLTLVTSKKHKQWFTYALIVEVGFCIFWSWFKLAGRGLI